MKTYKTKELKAAEVCFFSFSEKYAFYKNVKQKYIKHASSRRNYDQLTWIT